MRKLWPALVFALVAVGCGGTASVPEQPGAAPTTKAVKAPAGSITRNGTLIVGTEVKPGPYRAVVPNDSFGCYYARLSSLDDSDIVLGGNGAGDPGDAMTVTIKRTDKAFHTDGCGIWIPVKQR